MRHPLFALLVDGACVRCLEVSMNASKAAAIIRILSTPKDRDPRFVNWVVEKIERGKVNEC